MISSESLSPAHWNSFCCLSSSAVLTGFLVKKVLGEEAEPAGVRPVQDREPLGLHRPLEAGPHPAEDVVDLLVRVVHHGHFERVDRLLDLGEAHRGEHGALERAHLHLANDVRVVAGHAAGEEDDVHAAVGNPLPLGRHFLQHEMPRGALGHHGRHLDGNRLRRRRRGPEGHGHERRGHDARQLPSASNLHDHVHVN